MQEKKNNKKKLSHKEVLELTSLNNMSKKEKAKRREYALKKEREINTLTPEELLTKMTI